MDTGKNLLLYHLTKRYLYNMLKAEERQIRSSLAAGQPLSLLSVEESLKTALPVPGAPGVREVTIRGLADRIDRKGGAVRIIDYKTGTVKPGELSFKDWADPLTDPAKAKSFQLLCYAWLYHKNYPEEERLEPGIVSTRTPANGPMTLTHPEGKGIILAGHLSLFEEALRKLLTEILDPSRPFLQTENEESCRYCPFIVSCRRH